MMTNDHNERLPINWNSRWRDMWQERAGIMEFDGNMTRADAEQMALEDVKRIRKSIGLDK